MKVTQNPSPNTTALEKSKAAEKASQPLPPKTEASVSPSSSAAQSSVSISDQAQLMKAAREMVYAAPDIRAEKVADIKRRVLDGSYKVDSEAIADKLVDEHLQSNFGKNNL